MIIYTLIILIITLFFIFIKPIQKKSNEIISNIYVITLGQKERKKNIKEQEAKIKTKVIKFRGVDGSKLKLDDISKDNKLAKNKNHAKRQVGCYLSHLNIYKKIKKDNKKGYTLIFEDDFVINSPNISYNLKKSILKLNNRNIDFDFLFLGNTKNNYGMNIVDNIYYIDKKHNLFGTYGYIVNNKNISKIINLLDKITMPIDLRIAYLSYNNIFNTLVIYPNIVKYKQSIKSTINTDSNIK